MRYIYRQGRFGRWFVWNATAEPEMMFLLLMGQGETKAKALDDLLRQMAEIDKQADDVERIF